MDRSDGEASARVFESPERFALEAGDECSSILAPTTRLQGHDRVYRRRLVPVGFEGIDDSAVEQNPFAFFEAAFEVGKPRAGEVVTQVNTRRVKASSNAGGTAAVHTKDDDCFHLCYPAPGN